MNSTFAKAILLEYFQYNHNGDFVTNDIIKAQKILGEDLIYTKTNEFTFYQNIIKQYGLKPMSESDLFDKNGKLIIGTTFIYAPLVSTRSFRNSLQTSVVTAKTSPNVITSLVKEQRIFHIKMTLR